MKELIISSSTSGPLLTWLVAFPMLIALLIWIIRPLRAQAMRIALAASLFELLNVVFVALSFDYSAPWGYQLTETYNWIPQIGASWALGLNGIGLAMVALAALLVPIVLAAAPSDGVIDSDGGYPALILALEAFMMVIFLARDLLVFYVAFEAMLIPLYFLIGRYGRGENRRKAAIKFLLYSLAGGLVMLVGVVGLYVLSTADSQQFLYENLAGIDANIPAGTAGFLFATLFIAFAIKAPMVPVHTWLADTAEVARPGTSTLLVGVLDKIGTYGMIVLCLTIFPATSQRAGLAIVVLALISIFWGAFAALAQHDLMRLVSFTSVSHFGLMVMGIFIGNSVALTGAMVYMVAHGLSIAGMFLIGGFLTRRGGSQDIDAYGGMQQVTPVLAGTFLVSGLAAIALPGLSGFPAELMVLIGSFKVAWWAGLIGVLAVVFAALYVLWPYQRIFTGRIGEGRAELADMNIREKAAVALPLIALMLVLGFFPKPLVAMVEPVSTGVVTAPIMEVQDADAASLGSLLEEGVQNG